MDPTKTESPQSPDIANNPQTPPTDSSIQPSTAPPVTEPTQTTTQLPLNPSVMEQTFNPDTPGSPKLFPRWAIILISISLVILILVGIFALVRGIS